MKSITPALETCYECRIPKRLHNSHKFCSFLVLRRKFTLDFGSALLNLMIIITSSPPTNVPIEAQKARRNAAVCFEAERIEILSPTLIQKSDEKVRRMLIDFKLEKRNHATK